MSALEKEQTTTGLELVPNPMIRYLAVLAYETAKNNVITPPNNSQVHSHRETLQFGQARSNVQRDTGAATN